MLSKLVPADKQGKTLLGVCNTAPISWTDNGSVNLVSSKLLDIEQAFYLIFVDRSALL